MDTARAFVVPLGVPVDAIMTVAALERLKLIAGAVETLVAPDDRRREFLRLTGAVTRAYKAILPDERAAPFLKPVAVFHALSEMVRAKLGPVDISAVADRIAQIIDQRLEGVAILTPIIEGNAAEGRVDLSDIDFEALAKLFEVSPKVAAARLREEAEDQANKMARENPTRVELVERLEKLVAEYNAGSIDAEKFFEALKAFVAGLNTEQQRATKEGLTEAELAIFDLLTTPDPKLSKAELIAVKSVAKDLLAKLELLVQAVNWVGNQQTRGEVWTTIRQRLNELPEEPYPQELWNGKVSQVWEFVQQRYA